MTELMLSLAICRSTNNAVVELLTLKIACRNHDPALLKNALQQSHLLSGPNSKSLDTVKPCYEALFEFNSVGKAISTRQLHATGAYEDARPNVEMIWRKSAASNRVHQVLEVFMCRFNDGLSWKIQIDAAQSPPILSEEDRTFAASVNLESYDRDTEPMSAPRLRFQFVQNNNVRRVSQKTIWRTVLRSNSRWLVDVVRYDIFTKNQKGRTWSTGRPYWEILVHHRKWSFFNSSNTGNDSTIRQIKSILLPDDNEVEEHETVGIFCEMMDKISDAMSPSMI